jgi:hypothetical protein
MLQALLQRENRQGSMPMKAFNRDTDRALKRTTFRSTGGPVLPSTRMH